MLKKENPRSRMRCALSKMFTEMGVPLHTQAKMTECMDGKLDTEKEKLAELLIEIISTSASEEEMIAKSMKLI